MKFLSCYLFSIFCLFLSPLTQAADVSSFTPVQKQAIQTIVHDYLVDHPEVLMEAATVLQKKQEAQWQHTAEKVVPQIATNLFGSSQSPVMGNLKGNATLVEFFDYQCPHCKDMAPQLQNILKQDPNLKIIFKALPMFGDVSLFASQMALAAQKQGKFPAFHEALMKVSNTLTRDMVLKIATQTGLNIVQLQTDMKAPAIENEIKQSEMLAKQLKLTGTPAFVISQVKWDDKTHQVSSLKNTLLIPGAVSENILVEAIGQVRHSK